MTPRPRIPPAIWALGFVSLLMDVSSELIHSLLPVFMVTALGASALTLGLIEGAAEATALIVKVFSGTLSDYLGRRKPLAVLGYALGALSKPLFALASTTGLVLAARLIDRVGKGIRGAPRDALVADIAPPEVRGAAFGLRQALDTVGAFVGPLLAIGLMLLWANDFRAVFWVAVVPALLSVLLLAFRVQEPDRKPGAARVNPMSRANLRRLSGAYWWVVGVGAVFTLARFSEAFLVLRAHQGGLAVAWTPLVLVGMNLVYALAAYPFGKLSDRVRQRRAAASGLTSPLGAMPKASWGRQLRQRRAAPSGLTSPSGGRRRRRLGGAISHARLLALGLAVLIGADLLLAQGGGWAPIAGGIALWGLHLGITQGLLATMVADSTPADLRGTAYGFFNLVSGLAMLVASGLAGLLWDGLGASATFIAGAAFGGLALVVLLVRAAALQPAPQVRG